MEEGEIYRDHRDGLVFRVREIRGTSPDSVVAVEVLDEAVETYRTRREIEEGLEEGNLERAEDVEQEDFEAEEPELPLYRGGDDKAVWIKLTAVALAAAFVVALAAPATRIFAVFALKALVPLGALAVAAYMLYRYLEGEDLL